MSENQELQPYEDMLYLPHHQSARRPQMPQADRAAQFMPFAALTGYDAAIREEARRRELEAERQDTGLRRLSERLRGR